MNLVLNIPNAKMFDDSQPSDNNLGMSEVSGNLPPTVIFVSLPPVKSTTTEQVSSTTEQVSSTEELSTTESEEPTTTEQQQVSLTEVEPTTTEQQVSMTEQDPSTDEEDSSSTSKVDFVTVKPRKDMFYDVHRSSIEKLFEESSLDGDSMFSELDTNY